VSRGGARPNAGRKPGSKATKTLERLKKVDDVMRSLDATLPNAFKGDAHAFLCAVYKNPDFPPKLRLDAATAAIGYEKPRLAAVEHSGDKDNPVHMTVQNADADTFASRVVGLASREDAGTGNGLSEH
jgi:hypothetical protein